MQNTMNFLDALIKASQQCELQIYPGHRHGIRGNQPRLHLNRQIVEFFQKNLQNQ